MRTLVATLCWMSSLASLVGCPSTARILADRNRPHEAKERTPVLSTCSVPETPGVVEECTVMVEPRDVIVARELWDRMARGEGPLP